MQDDPDSDVDTYHQRQEQAQLDTPRKPFLIKLPAMARSVTDAQLPRRSTRHRNSSGSARQASGSEYSAGNASGSGSAGPGSEHKPVDEDDDEEEEVQFTTTSRGRRTRLRSYKEESDKSDLGEMDLFKDDENVDMPSNRRITRRNGLHGFIVSDEDGEPGLGRYATRSRSKKQPSAAPAPRSRPSNRRRLTRSSKQQQVDEEDVYVDDPDVDAEGSPETDELDGPRTSSPEPEPEAEEDNTQKTYSFRARTKTVNYAIPPPLDEVRPTKAPTRSRPKGKSGPGWSANGTELGRYMGMPADDSDSDYPTRTPRKAFGAGAGGGIFAAGGAGMLPGDLAAAAGTPSNLGKVGDAALADADPLGVNTNVTFDEVGGLDDHINSLKEMTLLPLLYPEVFQRFNLTPPRGVLFHGPPGTGKTLLARALAASCRSNGKGISFFMRKGADCLSKWVGEAERQLRLLFEEARNSQPSIIFFDEIDGLAPVRSSKQDQIHASIVSTLLALMDGMDGRGQVIVIGATNRPDAIDPALRRPGRFDREFYFALPNVDARAKILSIITKKWEGWQGEKAEETIRGLARTTKGYGGADLRALCTEAALNAVQRRYPQIYKSQDRLLLKPETIHVQARDFMISVKKLVPSSARSSSSTAAALPAQMVPLLEDTLEQAKAVLGKALPLDKKRNALEEAELEDDGDEGALEREIMLQSMETLRVYRPRVVLHGPAGMGQAFVGAAALHHLEGFHTQTLDLGNLMGDSTRTAEAAIVQLFVEAKRHQPSIIYIPSLTGWCAAVSETSRSTVRAMLDSLSPTDPILLLAVVDGPFLSLPRDVRAWFGVTRENRVAFSSPAPQKRAAFFGGLLKDVRRPPNEFPDGVKRRKRVLEELPIAPPLEPRQPTAAELAVQEENDQRIATLLKYRLGPILTELKRKFKRFTKRAADEYNLGLEDINNVAPPPPPPPALPTETPIILDGPIDDAPPPNGVIEVVDGQPPPPLVNGIVNGIHLEQQQLPLPKLFDIDLERIHSDLYRGKYLTPHDFLDDISKIVHNADVQKHEDLDRLFKAQAMFTAAQVSIQEFDPQLRLECERMAVRERERRNQRKEAKEKGKQGEDGANGQSTYAPGTRRSNRNNGLQPEMSITDPLLLERRLKRQRSNEAGDSHGSEEENAEDRDAKRSRLDVVPEEESGERDPLDIVGPTSSQPRAPAVRFAPDFGPVRQPSFPRNDGVPVSDADPFGPIRQPVFPSNEVIPDSDADPFDVVNEPRRVSNLDNLLNPLPSPSFNRFLPESHLNGHVGPYSPLANSSAQGQVFGAPFPSALPDPQPMFNMQNFPPVEQQALSSPPRTPRRSPIPTPTINVEPAEPEPQQPLSQAPMEIDRVRSPTPPLPEFHVDDGLLSELETKLTDETGGLNVEQLEQLRATALGCVWRHRQNWDRDELVRELIDVVKEFVEEVMVDEYGLTTSE